MEYNTNKETYDFNKDNKTEFVYSFHTLYLKESLLKGNNNISQKAFTNMVSRNLQKYKS
jgi:hypothetical protein